MAVVELDKISVDKREYHLLQVVASAVRNMMIDELALGHKISEEDAKKLEAELSENRLALFSAIQELDAA